MDIEAKSIHRQGMMRLSSATTSFLLPLTYGYGGQYELGSSHESSYSTTKDGGAETLFGSLIDIVMYTVNVGLETVIEHSQTCDCNELLSQLKREKAPC